MLYKLKTSNASSPRCLSGASLAQIVRRMTPPQRAVMAADIVDGRVLLMGLTAKSVAAIVGVNQGYLAAALRTTPEQRAAIASGERPLVPSQTRARPSAASAIKWEELDDDVLVEAVRRVGLDRALSAAIAVERSTN